MLFPAREVILTPERRERAVCNIRRRSNDLELPRGTKAKLAEMMATGLGASVNPLFYPLFYDAAGDDDPGARGMDTLFDYLPDGLLILNDPLTLAQAEKRSKTTSTGSSSKPAPRRGFT